MNFEELRQLKNENKIIVLDSGTNRWRIRQQVLISKLSSQALTEKEIQEEMKDYCKNQRYLQNTLFSFRKKGILIGVLINSELKYMHKTLYQKLYQTEPETQSKCSSTDATRKRVEEEVKE